MHVAEIWRYPVKSMAGERLEDAELVAQNQRPAEEMWGRYASEETRRK